MPALPGNFAASTHVLNLLRLKNKVLRTTGNLPERTSNPDLHVAFKIPYVYKFITKLCMQEAKVIQNHDKENHRNTG